MHIIRLLPTFIFAFAFSACQTSIRRSPSHADFNRVNGLSALALSEAISYMRINNWQEYKATLFIPDVLYGDVLARLDPSTKRKIVSFKDRNAFYVEGDTFLTAKVISDDGELVTIAVAVEVGPLSVRELNIRLRQVGNSWETVSIKPSLGIS